MVEFLLYFGLSAVIEIMLLILVSLLFTFSDYLIENSNLEWLEITCFYLGTFIFWFGFHFLTIFGIWHASGLFTSSFVGQLFYTTLLGILFVSAVWILEISGVPAVKKIHNINDIIGLLPECLIFGYFFFFSIFGIQNLLRIVL